MIPASGPGFKSGCGGGGGGSNTSSCCCDRSDCDSSGGGGGGGVYACMYVHACVRVRAHS